LLKSLPRLLEREKGRVVGRKRRVLIVCGTGIATSTVVAQKIRDYCAERGIEVDIQQTKVMETLRGVEDYDLVVSTTQMPGGSGVPTVNGMPFLTGVGVEQTLEEIGERLQS
jgi:PTS system galactitol-specific IIB component